MKNQPPQAITKKLLSNLTPQKLAISSILLAGFILRLRQYLTGRSLWVDEAMLALNIVSQNFIDLFKPLDYDQGAPIGFLLIEKTLNLFLGRNELVLRLFPLILGLLSLWTFYLLLKRFTRGTSLVISLALFAFNPRLVYYSSEVKQYIADVFVTIGLLLLASQFFEKPSRKGLGLIALSGFLALWLSHPAVFVLAGVGITLLISNIRKRDLATLKLVVGIGIFWLANIGIIYVLTLRDLQHNSFMKTYWQGAFAPLPPWSNWDWYWDNFKANADMLFSITFAPQLLFLLMVVGFVNLFKQKRGSAVAIAWMLIFSLLASAFALYPSLERMVLFLTPVGIILIGVSLGFIFEMLHHKPAISAVTALLAGTYLFYGAIPSTLEQFISPKYFEHIRPTMQFLKASWQDGDKMYVSNGSVPAYEYYAPMYGLENVSYIAGERDDYEDPEKILRRLEPLKGQRRVWVLFSHVYETQEFNEHDFLLGYLKENGIRRRVFIEPGTSVYLYLYDLNR